MIYIWLIPIWLLLYTMYPVKYYIRFIMWIGGYKESTELEIEEESSNISSYNDSIGNFGNTIWDDGWLRAQNIAIAVVISLFPTGLL